MFRRTREDIQCVFERDPAARTVWEVLTCYPGFHALCANTLQCGHAEFCYSGVCRADSRPAR